MHAILIILVSVLSISTQAQNSFTVPDENPCTGNEVVMYCYIEPPTNETFFFALFLPDISFNGSQPYTSTQINSNQIPGIDTSRYQINNVHPFPKDPKLAAMITITSYLPQDSATTFGCHGEYFNGSYSAALASGEAPMPASAPDQIYFVYASIESISYFCRAILNVRFSPPYSEKPIQYYELYSNNYYVRQLDNKTGLYFFDNPLTYLYMTPGESYSLRVAAVSCAGEAPLSQYDVTVSLPIRTLGTFYFSYLDSNNNLQLIWYLSEENSTTVTIGYSLQVTTAFVSGSTSTVVTQTTEFSQPSTNLEYEFKLGLDGLSDRDVIVNITTALQITEQCDASLPGNSETNTFTATSTALPSSIIYLTSVPGLITLIVIIIGCAVCNCIVVIALIVTCSTRSTGKYKSVYTNNNNSNMEVLLNSPGGRTNNQGNANMGPGAPYENWTAP